MFLFSSFNLKNWAKIYILEFKTNFFMLSQFE